MLCYKIVRPHDEVIVSIFRNKNDNTYSFINLTKGHICPCRFLTINEALMDLKKYIASVENFPKEGILFRDITPLMANGEAYKYANDKLIEFAKEKKATLIVGPEARGFIFGCPVAHSLSIGFVPVRKKGKLPRETISYTYELEYGTDTLYMHKDAIKKGQRVVIIDDLVAIGGTLNAAAELIHQLGGEVVGMIALIGLTSLPGIKNLEKYNLHCLLNVYTEE